MKNLFSPLLLLFAMSFLFSINIKAQESFGGVPVSFRDSTIKNRTLGLNPVLLPYINNEAEEQNANIIANSCNTCKSIYYGKGIDNTIDIKLQGQLLILSDSSKLWLLEVESSTAYAMQFYFDKFKLPEGASLFIFNEDSTMILGAFNSNNNPQDTNLDIKFGTQPIKGKKSLSNIMSQ